MKTLNFTVGPVTIEDEVLRIGAEQIPYFRTPEFSRIMLENEIMLLDLLDAPSDTRAVFLTGSGTSAMEAAVVNLFTQNDHLLVVNGGSFGERFAEICRIHKIPHTEINLPFATPLTAEILSHYENSRFTGMLVNIHETSTGILYDRNLIATFCHKNGIKLVVDIISSFLADEFSMKEIGATALVMGSQKAIALPPGISMVALSSEAVKIIGENFSDNNIRTLYLNLQLALKNGERGQTPFTPAVGILLQMHKRLCMIKKTGLKNIIFKTKALADDFRKRIASLPLDIASPSLSNAITPLATRSKNVSAYKIFEILKNEYNIFVCPNGGILKDRIFRVGHIGDLSIEDNSTLLAALADIEKRGLLNT